jgi:hypothetical protein
MCENCGYSSANMFIFAQVWAELEHRLTEPPNETRKKIITDGKFTMYIIFITYLSRDSYF